jgi:Phosphatase
MSARGSMQPLAPLRPLDPILADRLLARLVALKICGHGLSHSREANLVAIDKLLDRQPFYTLGIRSVEAAVDRGELTKEQVLRLVCSYTKESTDLSVTRGPNAINPQSCLDGLWEAAHLMRRVRDARGTVIFGAGHAGSMINCYNRLAEYFRSHGCATPIAGAGAEVQKDWYLDFVGVVAVVSDTCGLHHTHMTQAMAAFLDDLPEAPALAVCDHGFGGECINRGIPCVVPMDTNDPGFAVARWLGEDFALVPMNDNRPNTVMAELADVYIALIEAVG